MLSTSGGGGNHTLRWDTNNASATRFTTAFTGAVLDNNTGLVWEQAPDATPPAWVGALSYCVNKEVPATGGTRGWRLPSVVELASVQDPSLAPPFVPASVFTGVHPSDYWSATTNAADPANAWRLFFNDGVVVAHGKANNSHVWCVRGSMHADAYKRSARDERDWRETRERQELKVQEEVQLHGAARGVAPWPPTSGKRHLCVTVLAKLFDVQPARHPRIMGVIILD